MVKVHEAWGACRPQCVPNELANVIVDLDDSALNLSNEWLDADHCRRDYLGQDIHRLLTDATNTIYKAFLATLWPTAEVNRLSDREKIGDRMECALGAIVLHQVELIHGRRRDPISYTAWQPYWHMSLVCLAAKADWLRLGSMKFLQ